MTFVATSSSSSSSSSFYKVLLLLYFQSLKVEKGPLIAYPHGSFYCPLRHSPMPSLQCLQALPISMAETFGLPPTSAAGPKPKVPSSGSRGSARDGRGEWGGTGSGCGPGIRHACLLDLPYGAIGMAVLRFHYYYCGRSVSTNPRFERRARPENLPKFQPLLQVFVYRLAAASCCQLLPCCTCIPYL